MVKLDVVVQKDVVYRKTPLKVNGMYRKIRFQTMRNVSERIYINLESLLCALKCVLI